MDQNQTTQPAGAGKEDLRDLDARLKQIVKSLPATVVYNPLMTALALIPFVIAPGPFGSIPLRNLLAAIGIQIVTSMVARMVYTTNRHGGHDLLWSLHGRGQHALQRVEQLERGAAERAAAGAQRDSADIAEEHVGGLDCGDGDAVKAGKGVLDQAFFDPGAHLACSDLDQVAGLGRCRPGQEGPH